LPEKLPEKIVAIIPARGSSKGIPYKNIQNLAGKPLIAYTVEAALKSKTLDRVIVSTDDVKIAEIFFYTPQEFAETNLKGFSVWRSFTPRESFIVR